MNKTEFAISAAAIITLIPMAAFGFGHWALIWALLLTPYACMVRAMVRIRAS